MKDLISWCNRITPPNWHITDEPSRQVFHGPGTLNIYIRFLDHFIDGWMYAFKKGPMIFHPVSHYRDRNGEARVSLKKYGDYLVGESEILLYSDGCRFWGDDLFAATLHELAHVAVDRWRAFKEKVYRSTSGPFSLIGRPHHGEAFCRAFEIFIQRMDRFGDDPGGIATSLRSELEQYRLGLAINSAKKES